MCSLSFKELGILLLLDLFFLKKFQKLIGLLIKDDSTLDE